MTRLRLLSTVGAWLVVSLLLWVSDAEPSLVALAGIVAVVAAIGLVTFDLGRAAQTLRWPHPPEYKPLGEPREVRVPRPLHELDGAVRSQTAALRIRLIALVDDRLLTRHGIDRRADPAAAVDVLAPPLRRLVAKAESRIGSDRELSAIVDEVEAL